ncbi:hypothetical protein [Lignipirellula cremea]|uniref:Uncharacterized protein n=1 Tax=Lignipirellula cremea TaxID=2528010 RepID=A0A518E0A2_9BACT|nr:hypothetical protein [Lignipirellula cremea]QDU97526.1 hypothetical protein Pla8534_53740 [Lignipirellula cremea]
MNICVAVLATLALSSPFAGEPQTAPTNNLQTVRLDSLRAGDRLSVTTTEGVLLIEMVRPEEGEVRLATSELATPVRAYINGATRGPQPELFIMMGVMKQGLRLEIVETATGGPGSFDRRRLTAPIVSIRIEPRDRAA